MKKDYEAPILSVIVFSNIDIITASGDDIITPEDPF